MKVEETMKIVGKHRPDDWKDLALYGCKKLNWKNLITGIKIPIKEDLLGR